MAPEEIQGPRYQALPADTFGFSPSLRRRPRDPGLAPGAAGSPRLPVRLCLSLSVWLSPSLPPLPQLSLLSTDIHPTRPLSLSWQVTYPPKATPLRPHLPTL